MIDRVNLEGYATLHTHSEFSNLRLRDSINRIEEMLLSSQEKGLTGLCLTDHESLSGHIEINTTAAKLREQGKLDKDFKVMLGDEIYLIDDIEDNKQSGQFYHFLLIAKNLDGHKTLRKISNQAWENMFVRGGMERVPITKEQLAKIMYEDNAKGDLIASTACLGSEYAQNILDLLVCEIVMKHLEEGIDFDDLWNSHEAHLLLNRYLPNTEKFKRVKWTYLDLLQSGNRTEEEENKFVKLKENMLTHYVKWVSENLHNTRILSNFSNREQKHKEAIHSYVHWGVSVFGKEDYYIEIQPSLDPEQLLYNRKAIDIAEAYGLDYISTTDAHFINEEDITFQEAFLNAQDGDREVASFYLSCFIHTPEELLERLSEGYISEEEILTSMINTNKIADECEEYDLTEPVVVPKIEVSADNLDYGELVKYVDDYKHIGKFYNSDNEQDRYFLYLIQNGMEDKELDYTKERLDRIEVELSEIWQVSQGLNQKMSQYYISAREFINIMWGDGDSLVGVARGSITGMFTAYLIDIVQLNPMEHDLVAWRHIHHSRVSLADVDIDTEATKRERILEAMKHNFGEENVLNIGTFGREGTKSTIQTACRGLGLDSSLGAFLSSLVPVERGAAWSLDDMFEGNDEEDRKPQTEFINEVKKVPNLKETMYRFDGLVNKRSVHAAGIIFFDDSTKDRMMMMRSPSGQKITQYDMRDAEDVLGLVKMD